MLFHPPNKNTPFTYHESFSLKSFHVPKENICYANKKEKNIHAKKHETKNACQRA
jgi:hypothetical protein